METLNPIKSRRGPPRKTPRQETGLTRYLDGLDSDELRALAAKAGTSVDYLFQLKGGFSRPSVDMSRRLVEASAGGLSLPDCREDIWGRLRA
jgi:hypothetical protein